MLQPESLVLVCLLPEPGDLEIVRLLGWYRIPLRTAPKLVDVDYLAFYQPLTFGDKGGRIEYIARVKGHELTTRAELFKHQVDHPRAHEEYYKMQLDNLESLATPILADKWKRLTFLYTTGEYLLTARTFQDLVVRSDERQALWQALKEKAGRRYGSGRESSELDLDGDVLAFLLGMQAGSQTPEQVQPDQDGQEQDQG